MGWLPDGENILNNNNNNSSQYRIGERTETSVTSPSFHYVITGVGR